MLCFLVESTLCWIKIWFSNSGGSECLKFSGTLKMAMFEALVGLPSMGLLLASVNSGISEEGPRIVCVVERRLAGPFGFGALRVM